MPPSAPPAAPAADAANALTSALRAVLGPLARLAVARGVAHATLDELLKQAMVAAADEAHADLPPHRRVSRITTATGIHRREVTRLVDGLRQGPDAQAVPGRSHASELFSHWRTNPLYCPQPGQPLALPRQGSPSAGPSFEGLAQSITRDVHPRSLLDELLRLGLAEHDSESDQVHLVRDSFVPQGDAGRMAAALGRNVGSHLQAAVDNLLIDSHRHVEQAVFADGLSDASLAEFRQLARDQWQVLLALEALVARDEAAEQAAAAASAAATTARPAGRPAVAPGALPATPPAARHRVRLGLYSHSQAEPPAVAAGPAPTTTRPPPDPTFTEPSP